jgi:hypothetical protein
MFDLIKIGLVKESTMTRPSIVLVLGSKKSVKTGDCQ